MPLKLEMGAPVHPPHGPEETVRWSGNAVHCKTKRGKHVSVMTTKHENFETQSLQNRSSTSKTLASLKKLRHTLS